jgi:hypothetical protein
VPDERVATALAGQTLAPSAGPPDQVFREHDSALLGWA